MTDLPATGLTDPSPAWRRWAWLVLLALLTVELVGIGYFVYRRSSLPRASPVAVLDGHERPVWAVAFSPDGQTLGVAMEGGGGKLWDVATGKVQGEIRDWKVLVALGEGRVGFQGEEHSRDGLAQLSPGGKVLASAKRDSTAVSLVDTRTGKRLGTLGRHERSVTALAFSPDGLTLASSGGDGALRLWDVTRSEEHGRVMWNHRPARCLAFLPDGKSLISGDWSNSMRLWDLSTRTIRATIKVEQWVEWVAVSPDGQRFAVQSKNTGQIRDCETGKVLATFPPIEFADGALFSADGRRLAVIRNWPGEETYSVTIWAIPP